MANEGQEVRSAEARWPTIVPIPCSQDQEVLYDGLSLEFARFHWVQRSGQRIDKLHKLQTIENVALNLEGKSTYDVITDNATRWNSSEAMMERGYRLRNPLDSLVQAEVTEWSQYVARRTENGTKPMPKSRKKPAIVDDKMSAEDWAVTAEYLAILKPLKTATKRLEGRPEDGKYGAIWEVLLTL